MGNRNRIIGDTDDIILEELEGAALENPSFYEYLPQFRCIAVRDRSPDKVAVLANNGGGAEPMFAGLAGKGMADVCAQVICFLHRLLTIFMNLKNISKQEKEFFC